MVASEAAGKSDAAAANKLDASWVKLVDEAQTTIVGNPTVVRYGANDAFIEKTVTGKFTCSNDFFGSDPVPNVVKACYAQTGTAAPAASGATSATAGTLLASEGQPFTVAAATVVQYGAGSSWVTKAVTGSAPCSNAYFGSDPAPNVVKACYLSSGTTTATATTAGTLLANEGQPFTVATATLVQYGAGAGAGWLQKTVTGSALCTNDYFGSDPAPNVVKACYAASTSAGTSTSTSCSVMSADIVDASFNVVASAYTAMAAQLSKDAGIAYRYGSPCGMSSAGLPTYPQPGNSVLPSPYTDSDSQTYWQVGGPVNAGLDDYSSNQAQVAFVADNPAAASGSGGVGVSVIETLGMRQNTFTQAPALSWTNRPLSGGGMDDPSAAGYGARGPVALGRCYGYLTWCANSLLAFQSGLIGTAGSNTSSDPSTVQLAAGLVPTAVAVTNGGEFALVTVWDTVNVRGRLAVIALSERNRDTWSGVTMPGLPNQGAWGFMKIIGYVDLPGMAAPTDVSVTTGVASESMHRLYIPGNGNFVESIAVDLRIESIRQSFGDGGVNANSYARAGIAVVTSKSERKVTFIDMKPLFAYYRSVYFTPGNRASFDNAINNTGMAAGQWPYQMTTGTTPTVIKTVSLANRPTAVKVSLWGTQNAWIATEDGTLHVYNVGDYAVAGNTTASVIAEVGSVAVGKNPTHIAYDKHNVSGSVIVVSRGDRKIDWVTFAGNGGSIARTLRDTRMVDPVTAEDNDNHGTESYLLTVADYSGKQISNYRYGPVIFHTNPGGACGAPNGCGMAGQFEFGGALGLPGKPFHITSANVP